MSFKLQAMALVIAASLTMSYVAHLRSKISQSEATIAHLESNRDKLEGDIHTLKSNNDKLIASLDSINAAIQNAATEAQKANESFEQFSNQINIRFTDISKKADKVFNEPKPETCTDAINYLVDAVPEYVK